MLADKFQCYKLILIIIVALVAVFHTSLLHIDARKSELLSPQQNWETPAELTCGRTGATVRFENFSCDANREEWTIDLTPSDCQPLDCDLPAGMSLCLPDGNCTQITIGSTSRLEMDVLLEVMEPSSEGGDCKAHIVNAQTDQTPRPAWLLCNCPIRCPAVASPFESNSSQVFDDQHQDLEAELSKHNRGFWLYFVLRVIASGSLATSFSM